MFAEINKKTLAGHVMSFIEGAGSSVCVFLGAGLGSLVLGPKIGGPTGIVVACVALSQYANRCFPRNEAGNAIRNPVAPPKREFKLTSFVAGFVIGTTGLCTLSADLTGKGRETSTTSQTVAVAPSRDAAPHLTMPRPSQHPTP